MEKHRKNQLENGKIMRKKQPWENDLFAWEFQRMKDLACGISGNKPGYSGNHRNQRVTVV